MLQAACQQFLGKSEKDIQRIAQETLEGHQRAIMGNMTVEVSLSTYCHSSNLTARFVLLFQVFGYFCTRKKLEFEKHSEWDSNINVMDNTSTAVSPVRLGKDS